MHIAEQMHRPIWRESPLPLDWKTRDSQVILRFQEQILGSLSLSFSFFGLKWMEPFYI